MSAYTRVDIKKIRLHSSDWQRFSDLLFDAYNNAEKVNPVVVFIADTILKIDRWSVSDSFRYYRVFGNWPSCDATKFIEQSEQGPDFWWNLYAAYNRHDLAGSYKQMHKLIIHLL
jgi:hypothetical protein